MFFGAHLGSAGFAFEIAAAFRLIQIGARPEGSQDVDIADVETLEKIGSEQAFHYAVATACERRAADQPVGAQCIRNAPDPLEREIDTFTAPSGVDRRKDLLGAARTAIFCSEVEFTRDAVHRRF